MKCWSISKASRNGLFFATSFSPRAQLSRRPRIRRSMIPNRLSVAAGLGVCLALSSLAAQQKPARLTRTGVSVPGVKRDISAIKPIAVFPIEGAPDLQVVTQDAVWVANGPGNTVVKLDPKTNQVAATVEVGKHPCSGLATGFGSLWVPSCMDKTLSRV